MQEAFWNSAHAETCSPTVKKKERGKGGKPTGTLLREENVCHTSGVRIVEMNVWEKIRQVTKKLLLSSTKPRKSVPYSFKYYGQPFYKGYDWEKKV